MISFNRAIYLRERISYLKDKSPFYLDKEQLCAIGTKKSIYITIIYAIIFLIVYKIMKDDLKIL